MRVERDLKLATTLKDELKHTQKEKVFLTFLCQVDPRFDLFLFIKVLLQ